jgi:HAE1 family hydrophobic/amphiphilic exporter-1
MFKNKPTGFIPTEDEKRVLVAYEMAEGTSTERNIELVLELQKRIMSIPAVKVRWTSRA